MGKLDTGREIINIDGMLVEKDVLGIVKRLREYDDSLDIMYLDPDRADHTVNEAPYVVVERCRDGLTRRVFEAWTLDETILERVYNADTTRHDLMAIMDGRMVEFKNQKEQRFKEERAEARDVFAHLIKNPTSTYSFPNSHGQTVKMDDKYGVTHVDGQSVERG
jgi:hypothetical protein